MIATTVASKIPAPTFFLKFSKVKIITTPRPCYRQFLRETPKT